MTITSNRKQTTIILYTWNIWITNKTELDSTIYQWNPMNTWYTANKRSDIKRQKKSKKGLHPLHVIHQHWLRLQAINRQTHEITDKTYWKWDTNQVRQWHGTQNKRWISLSLSHCLSPLSWQYMDGSPTLFLSPTLSPTAPFCCLRQPWVHLQQTPHEVVIVQQTLHRWGLANGMKSCSDFFRTKLRFYLQGTDWPCQNMDLTGCMEYFTGKNVDVKIILARDHVARNSKKRYWDTRLDSASFLCEDGCKRWCMRSPWQFLCRSCCARSLRFCKAVCPDCTRCPKAIAAEALWKRSQSKISLPFKLYARSLSNISALSSPSLCKRSLQEVSWQHLCMRFP